MGNRGSAPDRPRAGVPEADSIDPDAIRRAVAAGFDVNGQHGRSGTGGAESPWPPVVHPEWTPLCTAADGGRLAAVVALLELGADPAVRSGPGRLPLHYAVEEGHASVAAALLRGRDADEVHRLLTARRGTGGRDNNDSDSDAGTDSWDGLTDTDWDVAGDNKTTPAMLALELRDQRVQASMFLAFAEAGATPELWASLVFEVIARAPKNYLTTELRLLDEATLHTLVGLDPSCLRIKRPFRWSIGDNSDRLTPLMAAAFRGNLAIARCLCSLGADVYETTQQCSSSYLRDIRLASEPGSDASFGHLTAAEIALGLSARFSSKHLSRVHLSSLAQYVAMARFLCEEIDRPRLLAAARRRLAWAVVASLVHQTVVMVGSVSNSIDERHATHYQAVVAAVSGLAPEVVAAIGSLVYEERSFDVAQRVLHIR